MTAEQELAQARARFQSAQAAVRATVARTRTEVAELTSAHQREKAEERVDEKFQKAARDGDIGSDMARIQSRVDRGEFTWDDALTGAVDDESVTNTVHRVLTPLQAGLDQDPETTSKPRRDEGDAIADPLKWRED